eukprot:1161105-Pelagomonas_calceolata.AAC.11
MLVFNAVLALFASNKEAWVYEIRSPIWNAHMRSHKTSFGSLLVHHSPFVALLYLSPCYCLNTHICLTPGSPSCCSVAHVPPRCLQLLRPVLQPRGDQQSLQGHELFRLPFVPGFVCHIPAEYPGSTYPGVCVMDLGLEQKFLGTR